MSRQRNRSVGYAPVSMYTLFQEPGNNPVYLPYEGLTPYWTFHSTRTESMLDVLTDLGEARQYNVCDHSKFDAAIIEGSLMSSSYDWSITSGAKFAAIPPSPAVGSLSIPWSDMVIQLSDLVRGRLSTKTLLGVTLRELPKTIRMVRNPFGLLKPTWRSDAGRLTATRLASRGANLWLEGQYGWGSALHDLKNFSSSYRKFKQVLSAYHLRGESGEALSTSRVIALQPSSSFGNTFGQLDEFTTNPFMSGDHEPVYGGIAIGSSGYQARAIARVSCLASNTAYQQYNGVDRLLQANGLDTDSVLPMLWEVLPYSFVVDWFVNLNAIRALPSAQRLSSEGVSMLGYSTKVEWSCDVHAVLVARYGDQFDPSIYRSGWNYSSLMASRASGTSYIRVPGLPSLMAVFLGSDLSAIQATSGISLIIQRLLH